MKSKCNKTYDILGLTEYEARMLKALCQNKIYRDEDEDLTILREKIFNALENIDI